MENIRVLLVDDEVEFLETLSKRMKKRGIDVSGVENGEEALAILNEDPVDVVVLDVRMPDMDGIDVLREIKRRHPAIQVVILTGQANTEVAVRGMELGAFDYLMKPIDVDALLCKIEDAYQTEVTQKRRLASQRYDT